MLSRSHWKSHLKRRVLYAVLLLGSVPSLLTAIGAAQIAASYFDKDESMVGIIELMQSPPPGLFPFLLLLSFVVISYNWLAHQKTLLGDFEREHERLSSQRGRLRAVVEEAFTQLQQVGSSLREAKDLVVKAGFPGDIIGIRGPLYLYTERAMEQWTEDQKKVLALCLALYPLEKGCGLLSPDEHRKFNKARRKLSKFWRKWGLRCFESNEIDFESVPLDLFRSEASYIVLLTYLEVAYARITSEDSPGKQGLFRITEAICRKLSLPVRGKVNRYP